MRAPLWCAALVLAQTFGPAFAQEQAARAAPAVVPAALPRYAIVAQDTTALRNGPRDAAPALAVLWQGDALEVRGQKLDYLQVYDHRRERGGYVRAAQVRTTGLEAADAPALMAVVRFVRDSRGAEALGLAYSAAYLKAAPAGAPTAEAWDAMGQMAERLARRASSRAGRASGSSAPSPQDAQLSGQLEGLAAYGVQLRTIEREGGQQLCYDGEAFGRVLAQASATPEQRARAMLALTRPDCQAPDVPPALQFEQDLQRARLLQQGLKASDFATLPELWQNRLQLRRAGVWAALAYQHARRAPEDLSDAQQAAQKAVDALAAVRKAELTDDDQADWQEAAVRVGASRWAALATPVAAAASTRPHIVTRAGQSGETCVLLVDARHGATNPLHQRCTYGLVWPASASTSPNGAALSLAVQPLAGWRELWLYRQTPAGWVLDTLPPGAGTAELGYIEFAGWVPGADRMLVAREARTDGRIQRSFEVLRLDTLAVDKQASTPSLLVAFGKWQDAGWKAMTVSVR